MIYRDRETQKRNGAAVPPFGSRAWFQMLLGGGPQRTEAEQAWDTAAQRVRSWLDKRGAGAQSLGSPREKTIKEPWRTVPLWKLNRALASLPHGYRKVFEMHERLGYTHKDIAEHFGCSVGNSKSQLHRARRQLRQSLRRKRPCKSPEQDGKQTARRKRN
jgi:DNA-directed RNA polymerase specialized sigma24 family protein